MAGRFSRRANAAIAHSVVDKPSAGSMPSAAPIATLRAIFSGVTPCRSRSRIGRTSRRLKNPSSTIRPAYLRILLPGGYRARMIVNYLPSIREALPHQCKYSSDVIFLLLQVPPPQDESRVRPQKPKLQFLKIQLPHRGSVRIILLVSRQHPVPAARHAAAPGKRQLRRMPVAFQEGVDVGAIPGGLLSSEDSANGFQIGGALARGLR